MIGITTHLIRLLRVRRAFRHDHKAASTGAACHGCDVEALLPFGHDPFLGEELIAQVIHLHWQARAFPRKHTLQA